MLGRTSAIIKSIAALLLKLGLKPNHVSLLSIFFSLVAATTILLVQESNALASFATIILCVICRLLCNLFDGIMAVEGGHETSTGVFFNEFPDRISDSLIFVSFGFAPTLGQTGHSLGWACALIAILTAYIRMFGAACGTTQDFSGPMAKQHRMLVIVIGSIVAAAEISLFGTLHSLLVALSIILVGGVFTCIVRTQKLLSYLNNST